jgi:hypothetical protein
MGKKGIDQIKKYLSSKHYLSSHISEKFTNEDLEMFRQIAIGVVEGISRGDRLKAFQILSKLNSQQDCEILDRVIGKENEDISLRAAAAINMAYLKSNLAEFELIKHLRVKNDLIRSKVIKSLGMIGGQDSYMALLGLENIQPDFIQKQLIFAKALIAYRLNLDDDPLPFISGIPDNPRSQDEFLKMNINIIGARKIEAALKRFMGSTYGIEISKTSGFEIIIGKAIWKLFINKQQASNGIINSISSRKMIIGLLCRWIKETSTYSPQYVILTKPTRNKEVQVMVIRSDGEMFYSGIMTIEGNAMSFVVSNIKRLGTAPTKVKGKLTLKGLQIETSILANKREKKRSPSTIEPEEFQRRFLKH